jgi:hypothetical protein
MNDAIGYGNRLTTEALAARYNLAIDLRDAAGSVACFTSDGEFAIDEVGPWTESARV